MSIVFALLAALSNAINVATQHVASTSDPKHSKGWQLVWYLVKNPLWLIGWIALLGAFVFQAVALHNGQISIVQPLLITELVFSLVLRQVWIRQRVPAAAWLSAAFTCVSVAVFIGEAEPHGGVGQPSAGAWISSIVGCGVVAGALALLSLTGPPGRRAALLAASSATVWAIEAAFIKSMTDVLTGQGLGDLFSHWPVYAVAVGGVSGVLLQQAALHVGPLRMSQPFLVIVDPLISIILSIYLFRERFSQGAGDLAIAVIAFVALGAGVVLMTRTVPETVESDATP
jgi:drug/metabolite transporter (DMT)-like permease